MSMHNELSRSIEKNFNLQSLRSQASRISRYRGLCCSTLVREKPRVSADEAYILRKRQITSKAYADSSYCCCWSTCGLVVPCASFGICTKPRGFPGGQDGGEGKLWPSLPRGEPK